MIRQSVFFLTIDKAELFADGTSHHKCQCISRDLLQHAACLVTILYSALEVV